MHIHILGTAAAEAIPNPFCGCATCEAARRTPGGRDWRMRSSALVNGEILIDIGPDVIAAGGRFGVRFDSLQCVLITHRHTDHFLASTLMWRQPAFNVTPGPPLAMYGSVDAMAQWEEELRRDEGLAAAEIRPRVVRAGETWQHGRYRITAVPANHGGDGIEVLLYVIEDGDKRIFYATDTGLLPDAAWDALARCGPVDLVLLDRTMGKDTFGGHHGPQTFAQTCELLKQRGVLADGGRIFAHHISHNGNPPHDELAAILQRDGVGLTYDGLIVEA